MTDETKQEETPLEQQEREATEGLHQRKEDRAEVMAEAAKAAREDRDRELVETQPEPQKEETPATVENTEPQAEEQTQQPAETSPVLMQDDDGNYFLKLKVDGQEQTMELSKAQAELQKRMAGDARLAQAAKLKADVEIEHQRVLQMRAEIENQKRQEEEAVYKQTVETQAQEIVKSMASGEDTVASEKLAALIQQSGTRPVTATPVPATVQPQTANISPTEQELATSFERFKQEYGDVVNDKHSFALADTLVTELQEQNPSWNAWQLMEAAGNKVREFRGQAQKPQAEDNRTARKQNLRPIPTGNAREELSEPAPVRKTAEDIVKEMNYARRKVRIA